MRGDIVDIRRNFWDDVTLNFEDAAESAESHASMKQQAEVLSERERSHRHAEEQLKTLIEAGAFPLFWTNRHQRARTDKIQSLFI